MTALRHCAFAAAMLLALSAASAASANDSALTVQRPIRIMLVGDSTLAPNNGYGDALCRRFIPAVRCLNLAKNGRSSGSYRAEGSWRAVQDLLADGKDFAATYVLVEFGHNDQPGKPGRSTDLATEFPVNLAAYVREVKAAGAIPLLVTPLTRRSFKGDTLVNDLQPWADTTRRVAGEQGVGFVDLLTHSARAVQAMGSAEADTLAVEPPPAVVAVAASAASAASSASALDLNRVEAVTTARSAFDRTHVGAKGAQLFARMMQGLLSQGVPELAGHFRPDRPMSLRPQLSPEQARDYDYRRVLQTAGMPGHETADAWDPLVDPLARAAELPADYLVDAAARANGRNVFNTVQAAVSRALSDARAQAVPRRLYIRVLPGVYRELVYVPASRAPITIYGTDADASRTVVSAGLDAAVSGSEYRARHGAALEQADVDVRAMQAPLLERAMLGTFGTATVWVRNAGFQARNITFENSFRREAAALTCVADCSAPTAAQAATGQQLVSHQAVALMLDGSDRAQFDNVRLLGLQDTLYLKNQEDGRNARMFFDHSFIEGDVDFIFGDATVFFQRTRIRSLGGRPNSYVGAPDTNVRSRYGFVFDHCEFTHDGSAAARAGHFNLARQWFHNQRCTPFGTVPVAGYSCTLGNASQYAAPRGTITQPVLETVGKMVVLHSRIGRHIDRARPWADWNQNGRMSYRPAQFDSDDYAVNLLSIGIDPVARFQFAAPRPASVFLAEFENSDD